jgi:hypothetical protein
VFCDEECREHDERSACVHERPRAL